MARTQADIANTAVRVFLQQMGAAYDEERGLPPYAGGKHFLSIREFFGERCCYCGDELMSNRTAQDHLVPMNKTSLGLHAWGNIVPACQDCNARKQGKGWHEHLVPNAGSDASERYKRVTAFIAQYKYEPDLTKLTSVAEELYAEIGAIAMTLISEKVKRLKKGLAT